MCPDIQAKAQAEIDAVVGNDRLPVLSDRSQLPYVEALLKEVHRWSAVGPLGVPHKVKEDDVHAGYLIPKGAMVFTNVWYVVLVSIDMH
jgi:cytochrome P450